MHRVNNSSVARTHRSVGVVGEVGVTGVGTGEVGVVGVTGVGTGEVVGQTLSCKTPRKLAAPNPRQNPSSPSARTMNAAVAAGA